MTYRGSWNRAQPSGYKLVRIRYQNGKPTEVTDLVTGFLSADRKQQFGRPCGIAQLPDGSILFTDDDGGNLYRLSYTASR